MRNEKYETKIFSHFVFHISYLKNMWAHITPVPNAVFDCYLKELKLEELKILLLIIRQTLGWKNKKNKSERKECDWISGTQLAAKTGCSKRAIISAIQFLVEKNLIDVLDESGELLDTPDKRKGKQKLFYRLASANFAVPDGIGTGPDKICGTGVENMGKMAVNKGISDSTNANSAEDLRKKVTALAQKMHYTKETLQNKFLQKN